ncbi:hypothetical protein ACQJBY_071122 [Aegilops geniculata]
MSAPAHLLRPSSPLTDGLITDDPHLVDHLSDPPQPHQSSRTSPAARYPETAAGTPVIDYIDDEPILSEQPDDGAQDLDATVDDASFYTLGAYYYVQPADDDQE